MVERSMDQMGQMFNKFCNLLERDIKGVHIGCYSVALIGLTIAVRKVRPFTKFRRPSDIPNHFIKERRELIGDVKRIDPNGGILLVDHQPIVSLPFFKSGELPVKISGVNINGLGLTWLHSVVAGQQIKFIPVNTDTNTVYSQVLLVEKSKNNKENLLNVGENLLKIGFGQTEPVHPPLCEDPLFLTYYRRLKAAENFALKKKLGLKYYIAPTKHALTSLIKKIAKPGKKALLTTKKTIKEIPHMSSA
ncbi:uncharacterized protein LOC126744880 [Anthonomus grandis grandis]|uniref:uncharacterized protein LOC126744880 n=1 Tax=Anthonomus grandis grandis TaxID=2921223 RepID=UPI0021662C4A|nr:uncharacterized protein LOC126744880 [Anthonomus grandis grandis]